MSDNIKTGKEIVVTASDEVGILSKISTVIAGASVNITAFCAYEMDGQAHFRLVTSDNEKAVTALNNAGFETTEHAVIMCEVSPHVLHPEIGSLAGGYDVENNYWCASAHSGEHALLIFSPGSNIKAAGIR